MIDKIIETNYPINFRKKEASELGIQLKNRNSVVLIGMKRVGISNFLRFFLNHKKIAKKYIGNEKRHLFIPVDLNDLVELEFFPFWILTLKRILDMTEKNFSQSSIKNYTERLFLDSMQSKDVFLTIESIRKSLIRLVEIGIFPTIFFIRFDRLKDIVTREFFSNLQGLLDSTNRKLTYVFTSYRSLTILSPSVFSKSSLSLFAQNIHIKPAEKKDTKIIFDTYSARYKLSLYSSLEDSFLEVVDGYIQYLQLALISLHESAVKLKNKEEFFNFLAKDERIILQSEELWESLGTIEQKVLLKIEKEQKISSDERKDASYLWDSGFITESLGKKPRVFSSLFRHYLKRIQIKDNKSGVELSKKEHVLFNFLKSKAESICEREEIVQAVWPEVEEFGVSDWAIDRLVARLRVKLKSQKAHFEIQTVKTRGYKMIAA
ncbi:MAG: helix-turn-helix domain-containing protein [Candidatus Levybacteria bacterium]|nr:helix-turn-helix domain-containing protein [Candidatus Levybacteria bacterium]